jgi:hypothetical protein
MSPVGEPRVACYTFGFGAPVELGPASEARDPLIFQEGQEATARTVWTNRKLDQLQIGTLAPERLKPG